MSTNPTLPMELVDTQRYKNQARNGRGRRKWLCEWSYRRTFTGAPIIGRSHYTDGTPDAGQDVPEARYVCTSIEYEGKGAGETTNGVTIPYAYCVVTAEYEERQGYGDGTLEDYHGDTRVLSIPAASGVTNFTTPVQKIFPMGRWRTTTFFYYSPNRRADLENIAGTINSGTWRGYPAGTVLFEKFDCKLFWDDGYGTLLQQITYYFNRNPLGWNYVPTASGMVLSSPLLYSSSNFANLQEGTVIEG